MRAGNFEAKPLLRFFGMEKAARASLMVYNTREEVDLLASALEERRLKGAHNRSSAPLRHRRCPRFRKPWVRRTPPRMAMQKARRFATPCRLSGSGLIPPRHHVSSRTQGGSRLALSIC